jgi:hypothetical protein
MTVKNGPLIKRANIWRHKRYVLFWCQKSKNIYHYGVWHEYNNKIDLEEARKMSEKSIFSNVIKSEIWDEGSIEGFKSNLENDFYMWMSSYMCVCECLKMRTIAIRTCNDDFECVTGPPATRCTHTPHKVFFFKYFERKQRARAHFWCVSMMINMQNNFLKTRHVSTKTQIFELKNRWRKQLKRLQLPTMIFLFLGAWQVIDSDNNKFESCPVGWQGLSNDIHAWMRQ